jgi:hypothetical protein
VKRLWLVQCIECEKNVIKEFKTDFLLMRLESLKTRRNPFYLGNKVKTKRVSTDREHATVMEDIAADDSLASEHESQGCRMTQQSSAPNKFERERLQRRKATYCSRLMPSYSG